MDWFFGAARGGSKWYCCMPSLLLPVLEPLDQYTRSPSTISAPSAKLGCFCPESGSNQQVSTTPCCRSASRKLQGELWKRAHTQRDRQTDRQTDRLETWTETERERERQRETETDTDRDRDKERQTETDTWRKRDRYTKEERQTDRQRQRQRKRDGRAGPEDSDREIER